MASDPLTTPVAKDGLPAVDLDIAKSILTRQLRPAGEPSGERAEGYRYQRAVSTMGSACK
jgi:hypothetical protein